MIMILNTAEADVSSLPLSSFLCSTCEGRVAVLSTTEDVKCASCGRAYPWRDGILILGDDPKIEDYPKDSYDLLITAQARHFWFPARNRIIIGAMREVIGDLQSKTVIDVGCGDGYVTTALEKAGMVSSGLDMFLEGLTYARSRMKGHLYQLDASRIPFKQDFDAACLFDVIEHVDEDVELLRASASAVRPGGHVVVTVPANPALWTQLDDASGHKRRYTKATLTDVISSADLEIKLIRYFNIALQPLQTIQRRLMRSQPENPDLLRVLAEQSLAIPPAPANFLLGLLMRADPLLGRLPTNFGTSLVAVAKVKDQLPS